MYCKDSIVLIASVTINDVGNRRKTGTPANHIVWHSFGHSQWVWGASLEAQCTECVHRLERGAQE
jgi:hypothetical protein